MIQALNILSGYNLAAMKFNSAEYIHTVVEALKLAYADRDTYYGDPKFNTNIPAQTLLSKEYAAERRKLITARASQDFLPGKINGKSGKHPAESEMAMLKIDVPEAVPKVDIHDNYDTIKAGDNITVLGYPAVSPVVYGTVTSQDVFNRESQLKVVPDPSVTTGNIGRILRGTEGSKEDVTSSFGDAYQVTANPGAGNSGGPVFDDRGGVIGIYYAGRSLGGATAAQVSFAVPIKFAKELMSTAPQP